MNSPCLEVEEQDIFDFVEDIKLRKKDNSHFSEEYLLTRGIFNYVWTWNVTVHILKARFFAYNCQEQINPSVHRHHTASSPA